MNKHTLENCTEGKKRQEMVDIQVSISSYLNYFHCYLWRCLGFFDLQPTQTVSKIPNEKYFGQVHQRYHNSQ